MSETRTAGLSYRDSGVDIDSKNRAFDLMKDHVRSTFGPRVLSDFGTFGPMYELPEGQDQPVLVASTDSVGTKLKIAFALDKHDTVGIDIVNHCVDDILTTGAEPLFFLDYYGTSKLCPETLAEVMKGLSTACREAGCALLGGETAELPSFYASGEYDLVGFVVGLVERKWAIDGKRIEAGDVAIGLPSSGLHTNGYSLARKVFGITPDRSPEETRAALSAHRPELGRTLAEELLEPHRSYLPWLRPFLRRSGANGEPILKGLAHVTGGGLLENVPRVLPEDIAVRFHSSQWTHPPVFTLIQRLGQIADAEMYRTFNNGVGMVVIVAPEDADTLLEGLPASKIVGEAIERTGEAVEIAG